MRTVEIIGFKRANLGKSDAKALRAEGNVPCVLYGGEEQVHFYSPMILFRDLVYTPEIAFVELNIEGDKYKAILQDSQYHPVSETILHADFLLLNEEKPIVMNVPITFVGNAPGIVKGGKLAQKLMSITVKALPANMPEKIVVDISSLDLGKSIKINALEAKDYQIINNPMVSIATIAIPRALKSAASAAGNEN